MAALIALIGTLAFVGGVGLVVAMLVPRLRARRGSLAIGAVSAFAVFIAALALTPDPAQDKAAPRAVATHPIESPTAAVKLAVDPTAGRKAFLALYGRAVAADEECAKSVGATKEVLGSSRFVLYPIAKGAENACRQAAARIAGLPIADALVAEHDAIHAALAVCASSPSAKAEMMAMFADAVDAGELRPSTLEAAKAKANEGQVQSLQCIAGLGKASERYGLDAMTLANAGDQ